MEKGKTISKKDSSGFYWFIVVWIIFTLIWHYYIPLISLIYDNLTRKRRKNLIAKQNKDKKIKSIQEWFYFKINKFAKECLAYGIELEADKAGVSIYKKEELREKYGKVLLKPELPLYTEYKSKFGNDSSPLEVVVNKWLNSNTIKPSNDPLKQIEYLIIENNQKLAKNIIQKEGK